MSDHGDEEVDLLVLGTGAGGLSAAVTAAAGGSPPSCWRRPSSSAARPPTPRAPAGSRATATRLRPETFVGDVVTRPAVPPLVEAARRAGCRTSTGGDMFEAVAGLIADFLLGDGALARRRDR